jgi:ribosomal protein S18 acetylase RimI-like enzyme
MAEDNQSKISVERLQAYMRQVLMPRRTVVAVPPFTLFLHPHEDMTFFNYAIPDEPAGDEIQDALIQLRAAFAARARTPRFEFIEEYAPTLAVGLRAAGFVEQGRYPLMVCTPETWRDGPQVPGLSIVRVGADAPEDDISATIVAQQHGFNPADVTLPNEADIRDFRESQDRRITMLGRIDGEPAGAGVAMPPYDQITEIGGVATLVQFRRRGIAAAVTAALTRAAFDAGARIALLTAADTAAGRVYERAGFRTAGTGLAYIDDTAND